MIKNMKLRKDCKVYEDKAGFLWIIHPATKWRIRATGKAEKVSI